MKFEIKRQEKYSRGQLLLRTFFGWLYIAIPHMFVLTFVGILGAIFQFLTWWAILFTGRYPRYFFSYQLGVSRWTLRVNASIMNLTDHYPEFGISIKEEHTILEIPYPEKLSRGMLLLKTFFGMIYVLIPHGIVLMFLGLASGFVAFVAWWVVLFTATYPESMFDFMVGVLRWQQRVNNYFLMTDTYPPFSLAPDPEEVTEAQE
jgi:hypothetical protein